ncbi:MAG: D-alanyl-D-alanine carboxypeptidase family protein [Acidimicrobiaceae bacterium]|nr:D-alanyl-D-alanine carboxypeptidase family protein [Acidimicrobiaceae bacterium]
MAAGGAQTQASDEEMARLCARVARTSATQSGATNADLRERRQQLEQEQTALQAQLEEEERSREETQAALFAKVGEVDLATADVHDVLEAFDQLKLLVNEQRADLDQAELELAAAEASVEAGIQRVLSLDAQHAELGERVVELIVQTYIGHDASVEGSYGLVRTGDIYDAARIRVLIGAALGDLSVTGDQLRALGVDAELAVREFQRAEELRDIRREESAQALDDLLEAVEQEAILLEELENRLDKLLFEQVTLEEWDAEAAADVAETTSQIAGSISQQQRISTELKRRSDEERCRAWQAEQEARRRREGTAGQPISNDFDRSELTWVGGIQVHESIADNVRALLDHAARDPDLPGRLTGSGYRSAASQIALRRAHCGTSQWAVYQKPSYQCRPPTARPGRSMHERGLAIDFVYNGRSVTSRNSTAFQWLKRNAATYGLYNLPSEPWHWSTNGN